MDSLNKKGEHKKILASVKKEASLERVKKLSYLKQAIVLSEILGTPKGLDI